MDEVKPPELPDTSSWQPRDASRSLSAALEKECAAAEARILQGLNRESALAVDNFDTGLPFEGLIRKEISQFLPKRYNIGGGLLLDRLGKTAGRCDIVLYNNTWFCPVKSPASEDAGLPYIPIEGAYAVGEVKQSLCASSLDRAMEKLVHAHRLVRPKTLAHRVVENREGNDCPHGLTNPLFSFVVAGSCSYKYSFQSLAERFFQINQSLKRLEVIRFLCVLNEGVICWAFRDPLRNDEVRPALFLEDDLFHPIFPVYFPASDRNPFYGLIESIHRDLFDVVLGPEDIAFAYSRAAKSVKIPKNLKICLNPDQEWLDILERPCTRDHNL